MGSLVRLEHDGDVAVVRIDRPKVNALNAQVVVELGACCEEIASSGVRAAVVYGGEKTFSAGADLREMGSGAGSEVGERVRGLQRAVDVLEQLPVVTIAAVTGYALGGGCEIAMGCDFRFAASDAKLGQPEIVVGLIPGAGGTQRLPRLIGPARAKWMIYTGEFVDAATAHTWGLVDRVCEPGTVLEAATEAARRFASGPTLSLAAAKRSIQRGLEADLAAGLEIEIQAFASLFQTHDTRHGLESFAAEGPGKARFTGT